MSQLSGSDTHPSTLLYRAIRSQEGSQETAAHYLAATIDGEFWGQDVAIMGEVRVTVSIRERATGRLLGQADHAISLPVSEEHQPQADTDVLEVNPGSSESSEGEVLVG